MVPNKETPVGRDSSPAQNLVNVTTPGYTLGKVYNGWVGVGLLVETPNGEGGWNESGVLIQGYSVVSGVARPDRRKRTAASFRPFLPTDTSDRPRRAQHVQSGDPINTANGDVISDATDFSVPNLGTPLEMSRHYHSINTSATGAPTATPDRGMGDGWSFTYSDTLTVNADKSRDMVH